MQWYRNLRLTTVWSTVLQLDHVGIVTRDLQLLRERWLRLGFAPTAIRELYRIDSQTGERVPLGQRSCHAVFAQSYVELSEVTTSDASHHLAHWQARGPGLDILALSSTTLLSHHARLAKGPYALTPLADASRRIDYGSSQGDARFSWCMLAPSESPEGLVCLMQHLSPELVYQAEVQQHPNGAVALEEILISMPARDLAAMSARYQALLDVSPLPQADGAVVFELAHGRVSLVPQSVADVSLPRLDGQAHFAALVIAVKDIEQVAECLRSKAVAFKASRPSASQSPPIQLIVDEADVGGARLIFRQARV